ncbi:MAG: hypothetical protein OXG09_02475 [Chloroflexi bacterium]|nr:hypothetical protein [Chloroflexota bacterium]
MEANQAIGAQGHTVAPFWPRQRWWLALLVILLLAGALRFPGYDFGLPFIEHEGYRADEIYYTLGARWIIDTGTAKPLHLHNYPPGILALNYLALRWFPGSVEPPAAVIGGMRLLSISVSLATVVAVAFLGRQAGGPLAGLISAGIWAITPVMVEFSRYASADIYVTGFTILALWLALAGTVHQRWGLTTAGTYALMLAITFKYTAMAITPLVLFIPLIRGRVSGRRVLGNCGRLALFLAWLFLLTPALDAIRNEEHQISNAWVQTVEAIALPGLPVIRDVLQETQNSLDLRLFIPGWLGLIIPFFLRSRAEQCWVILICVVTIGLWLVPMALFNTPYIRFMLPAVSLMIVLPGVGYAFWWQFLQQRFAFFSLPLQRAMGAAALLALLALNLPLLQASVTDLRDRMRPDQRNDLAIWADETLPSGRYITDYDNHRTLNREWGGYAGETRFHYAGNVFSEPSLEQWREQGVHLAIVDHFLYHLWREDGDHPFTTQTTLLKSYPPSHAHRGPAMVVLRLYPIQHPASGQLGPIRLLGYDMTKENVGPGEALPFHLYWQAAAATQGDYQVFNHLLDAEGSLVAQADGPPLPDPLLRRGTKDWHDPDEIIFSREFLLQLPEDLAPGEYSLVTGFYHRLSGLRLLSPAGEDTLWVTHITVE